MTGRKLSSPLHSSTSVFGGADFGRKSEYCIKKIWPLQLEEYLFYFLAFVVGCSNLSFSQLVNSYCNSQASLFPLSQLSNQASSQLLTLFLSPAPMTNIRFKHFPNGVIGLVMSYSLTFKREQYIFIAE